MNGRVVASKGINGGFFVSSRYCSKEPSVPCPATYGVMEVILLREKFLQFDWLRAVVFQLNLKYLHGKITILLWVVV